MPLQGSSPLGLQLETTTGKVNKVGSYVIGSTMSSIFSGKSYDFPNPLDNKYGIGKADNDSLDISTTNIIEKSQKYPASKLSYSDFAYLKNLGVYPNNRLIIARRFQSGVHDDLTILNTNDSSFVPMATLISWVPDNENFISTEFGEEWEEAKATFKDILNDLGNDVMMGDNRNKMLGNFLAGGGGVTPFPGFTEGLQYEILKNLGYTETDSSKIPSGNPNLIREAKQRKTVPKSEAGSGLKCKFEVKMVVEYEQKFINGIDPTMVYYDIIANALTFGTSESQFQFSESVSKGLNEFLTNIGSGDSKKVKAALVQFVAAIGSALRKIGEQMISEIKDLLSDQRKILSTVSNTILKGLVSKYKVRIMGVANALTGTPSAPWHVTIGNPNRPIFSSGDMLVENVTITMGKLLAFNDLPSSIKLELTLKSARNLGAQEIYTKFNCGKQRTYVRNLKTFVETDLELKKEEIDDAENKIKLKNDTEAKVKNDTEAGVVNVNTQTGKYSKADAEKSANAVFPSSIKSIPGQIGVQETTENQYLASKKIKIDGLFDGDVDMCSNHIIYKNTKIVGTWYNDPNDNNRSVIYIDSKPVGFIDADGKITKTK